MSCRIACCVGLSLAFSAIAQEQLDAPEGRRGARPGERRMLERAREGFTPQRMVERLARELDLDEQQQQQLDEIVARHMPDAGRRAEGEQRPEGAPEDRPDRRRDFRGGMEAMNNVMQELEPILRDDQRQKLTDMRQRMQRRGPGGPPPEIRQLERMADELELDESQREQFNQILQSIRQEVEQTRGRPEEMGQLWQELREAREAGNEDRVQEIEGLLAARRPDRDRMLNTFFEQFEPILRDDQRQAFEEQKRQIMRRGNGAAQDAPRQILRAARRLELRDDQREQLEQIEQDFNDRIRDAREREARTQLVTEIRREVTQILDDEQKRDLERQLQRGGREGRDGRGGREFRRDNRRPDRQQEGGQPDDESPR